MWLDIVKQTTDIFLNYEVIIIHIPKKSKDCRAIKPSVAIDNANYEI